MVQIVQTPTTGDWLTQISRSIAQAPGPLIALAVALLYMASAQYVILLNDPVNAGAGFWPPAGISLAALLLLPRRKWSWVLGAVAVAEIGGDTLHGYPLLASIPWAAANVLEPLVAALLLLRFGGGGRLTPVPNLLWFLGCGVLIGPVVGALVGSVGTILAFERSYTTVVTKWIIGDGLGALVVAPLLLSIREWRPLGSKGWEAAILGVLVVSVTALGFYPWNTEWDGVLPYLTAPLLIWAGVRFGVPGAAAAGFIVVQGANIATGLGYGPLRMAASPQGYTITLLQVFTGILLTTGLVVAALAVELAERRALEQVLNDQAEKLRQSEAQLRDYAEVASDWLWETNDQFRFTRFEGNSRSETARLKTKMLGKTCWEAAGAPTSTAEWQEYIRRHKAHEAFRDFTYSIADDSGQAFHLSSSGRPLFGQQGQFLGYRGVSTDLTEKMRLEAQLRHSQKMEALGQLTGGLAHDFNNLLTVILGNAETIAEMTEDQKLRSLAEMIQSAADRGSDLTQKLLSFGRRQSLSPKPLILREVLSNLEGLLRRALGEHIELEIHAPESQWLVVADQGQLESAILNLVLNARDAMPMGGVLRIETNEIAPAPGKDAFCLSITVSDTGTGMAPEVMERAFEPFYSTKEVGKGSGLGLSMVYGFAEQSGGHVSISSKVGEGTSITIGLPAQLDARAQSTNDAEDAEPIPDGKERILVVEDDPQVLQFVTAQLLSLGYDVTAVSVGMDALERLEQDGRYDVLFTDVVLPKGMSGVEVARRARDLKPDLKVLLTSGYSEDVFEQHGRPDEGTFLLRKPYRRRELAETLRKVLDQEQA